MNKVKEAIKYFNGYGSPYDDLIIELLNTAIPIPAEEWSEDDGSVIWWRLPVEEQPYVGSPLCDDFTYDYYTHFTRIFDKLDLYK